MKTSLWAIGIAFVVLVLLVMAGYSATSSNVKHSNSLGVVQYQENPYTYISGSITEAVDVEAGKGLVVRIRPTATYELFTQDILLCNSPIDLLQGKSNPMVLTYETRARRTVSGIGCHVLVRVEEIKNEVIQRS